MAGILWLATFLQNLLQCFLASSQITPTACGCWAARQVNAFLLRPVGAAMLRVVSWTLPPGGGAAVRRSQLAFVTGRRHGGLVSRSEWELQAPCQPHVVARDYMITEAHRTHPWCMKHAIRPSSGGQFASGVVGWDYCTAASFAISKLSPRRLLLQSWS